MQEWLNYILWGAAIWCGIGAFVVLIMIVFGYYKEVEAFLTRRLW